MRHGTIPSVTERWRSNMTQEELLPHALVTAMMFLTLLGTVGCMTWHQAVTSAAGDVASTIDPASTRASRPRPNAKTSTASHDRRRVAPRLPRRLARGGSPPREQP